MTPARYIIDQMDQRGWSQKETAKRIGISTQYLNDILKNRKNVHPKLIRSIAHAFAPLQPRKQSALIRELHYLGATFSGWLVEKSNDYRKPHGLTR